MVRPAFSPESEHFGLSRLSLAAALLLVVAMALSYLPLVASGGEGGQDPEVWFSEITHTLQDNDEDGLNETISIAYDIDTDDPNGTEVRVKLYVKNGEGHVIDDPVNEHFVENGTAEEWYHNWSAEVTDNYTFELKLYQGDRLADHETLNPRLEVAESEGTVHLFVINDYDGQHGQLNIDDEKERRWFDSGENDLGEFTLSAGNHRITIELENGAEAVEEFELEDDEYLNLTLTPFKDDTNGTLEIWVKNHYEGQWGDLYLNDDFVDEYEVPSGRNYLDTFELEPGEYLVSLELENRAFDELLVEVHANQTTDILLIPELTGELEVWIKNDFDGQWGALYFDDDLVGEYEVPAGRNYQDTYELPAGEHLIYLELENGAFDELLVEVPANDTLDILLIPEFSEEDNTINVEGSVRAMGEEPGLNDLHFYAHVRAEAIEDVAINIYAGDRGGPLRSGTTNGEGRWATADLDPGRYEWEAILENETLEEGVLKVYGELNKAARGDIYPVGSGEPRHWNLFKVIAYDSEGNAVEGAKVKLMQGDRTIAQGHTNADGIFAEDQLVRGWYHYRVEWPVDRGEPLLLSESGLYSYGPPEDRHSPPRLFEPWLHPMEGNLDTRYNFSVNYQDDRGRAPDWVKVFIDERRYFLMDPSGDDWVNGVEFFVSLPGSELGPGNHKHQFKAKVGGEILELDESHGPNIEGQPPGPTIEILAPLDGAQLANETLIVVRTEARGLAPFQIRLSYEPLAGLGRSGDHLIGEFTQYDPGEREWNVTWNTMDMDPGTYNLIALIKDKAGQAEEDVIQVEKPGEGERSVALAIEPPLRTVRAGQEAIFTITVTNTGAFDETYLLTALIVNASSEDWEYTLEVTRLEVAAGEFGQTTLVVQAPLNATTGDLVLLTVTVFSTSDPQVSASGVASAIVASDASGEGVLPALSTPAALAAISTGVVVASFRRRLSQ